jgi:hypothetical protein
MFGSNPSPPRCEAFYARIMPRFLGFYAARECTRVMNGFAIDPVVAFAQRLKQTGGTLSPPVPDATL